MNTKIIFLLLVAVGCGTVAAVAGSQMMKSQKSSAPERPMTDVVVASTDVAVSAPVTAEQFRVEKWPIDRAPQGSIKSLKEAEGKFTNQRMYAGEPLLEKKIVSSKDSIASTIPDGYRVFDMPIGESSYIKPGDHVDVFGYFEKSSKITQTRSIRILENVTVLMVDGVAVRETENDGKRSAKTVQLLIKDSQYEALTTAANLGKLRIALCGYKSENESKQNENGEEFLAWVANSVQSDSAPTSGAPQLPPPMVFTEAPAEEAPTEKEEEFSVVIYSGGKATEYRWKQNEYPQEFQAEAKAEKKEDDMAQYAKYSAPPGKFTGESMLWDAVNQDWSQTEFKSGAEQADANSEELQ